LDIGIDMSCIKLKNVSLEYIYAKEDSIKNFLLQPLKRLANRGYQSSSHSVFRALNDVNLTINEGDRIALIGRNGAGKSTLLRVLAGIYQPTEGQIQIDGTISSLLEINVGLHEEATGRENIIMIGLLMGQTKRQMLDKLPSIEEFTELREFLNAPVRTYSTGMRLRLVFAIVTSIEPDILLLDEAIGVGDQIFLEKAQKRLEKLIEKSNILVLASHSSLILQRFCNKALVMHQGHNVYCGGVKEAFEFYDELTHRKTPEPEAQTA
jgi:ABC-type polysaccharide/polyol phosphate transport system ATPase subunit